MSFSQIPRLAGRSVMRGLYFRRRTVEPNGLIDLTLRNDLYAAHGFAEGPFHQPARRLDCRRTRDALSDDRRRSHLERGEIDRLILAIRPQFSGCHAWVGERRKRDHRPSPARPVGFSPLISLPSGHHLRMFPLLQGRHFLLRCDSAIIQTEGARRWSDKEAGWLDTW